MQYRYLRQKNEHRFKNFEDVGCNQKIDTNTDDFLNKVGSYTNNDLVEVAFECSGSEELLIKSFWLDLSK